MISHSIASIYRASDTKLRNDKVTDSTVWITSWTIKQ